MSTQPIAAVGALAPNMLACSGDCDCFTDRLVAGKPLCFWCEDGVPCPAPKRQKFNSEFVEQRMGEHRGMVGKALREAKPRFVKELKKAATKAVVAAAEEMMADETAKCAGYGSRKGICKELISARTAAASGLCKRCYANKNYADCHTGHRSTVPKPKRAKEKRPASGEPEIATITVQLSETQVDTLLLKLPLDVKTRLMLDVLADAGMVSGLMDRK